MNKLKITTINKFSKFYHNHLNNYKKIMYWKIIKNNKEIIIFLNLVHNNYLFSITIKSTITTIIIYFLQGLNNCQNRMI